MSELPKWPAKGDFEFVPVFVDHSGATTQGEPYFDEGLFARARADAAMARLRVAVEALRNLSEGYDNYGFTGARKALEAIGELPPE